MSFFSRVFGQSDHIAPLVLKSFSADYLIKVYAATSTVQEEKPFGYNMQCEYTVKQEVFTKEIVNNISLTDININTENDALKNHVDELTILSKISPIYELARSLKGNIKEMRNADVLLDDWKRAKKTIIPELYKTNWEQQGIVIGYEKGLPYIHKAIGNNWHFLLMLPDIYHFIHHVEGGDLLKSDVHRFKSGLLPNFNIDYHMVGISSIKENGTMKLKLKSKIKDDIKPALLKLKETDPEIKKYLFLIDVEYEIDMLLGKVIKAHANVKEELNDTVSNNKSISLMLKSNV